MQRVLTTLGYFLLFFLAFGVAIVSMRYWSFVPRDILSMKDPEVLTNLLFRTAFYGHVIFGPIALMTGPFQFLPKLRARNIKAHRLLGAIYIVSCLLSGLAGLLAAQWANGGHWTELGFSLLAVSWIYTTTKAYLAVRKKDISAHQKWMVRSYALTLSAVTLRLYLPVLQGGFDLTFIESYQMVAWLCWIPNIIVAELWLRTKQFAPV